VHLAEVLEGGLELVGVVIVACMGVVQTRKGRGHDTERMREQEVINHWRLSRTHYMDIVEHNNDRGLKVTDPRRLTTSSLKERELRS